MCSGKNISGSKKLVTGYYSIVPLFAYFYISDINECVGGSHNCHVDSNCSNTKGSFYCTCLTGYSGDGVSCVGMYTKKSPFSLTDYISPMITCVYPFFTARWQPRLLQAHFSISFRH